MRHNVVKTLCDSLAESHENLWNASDVDYEYGVVEICGDFNTLYPGLLTWSFSECPYNRGTAYEIEKI